MANTIRNETIRAQTAACGNARFAEQWWPGSSGVALAVAAVLVFALSCLPARAAAPPSTRVEAEPDGKTIERLVRDLGHAEAAVREAASQRLLRLGPAALWHCRSLCISESQKDNLRWQRSFFRLVEAIQRKYGVQRASDKGLEFLPTPDLVWRIPKPGEEQPIKLDLKVTNVGEKPVVFNFLDTVRPYLNGPDGEQVKGGGGRDHLRPGSYMTPPLAKGQSYVVTGFRAKLCRSEDGKKLWVDGYSTSGYFLRWKDLKPGRYYLWYACGSDADFTGKEKDGVPIWSGGVGTPFVVVEIK